MKHRALAVSAATFLLHTLVALLYPLPGTFRKYSLAAEHFLSGELPTERLMDFSPFYFQLSLWAEQLLPQPEWVLTWLQIGLAAASVGLVFHLLERRFSTRLALGAAVVMAFDRHLLVYERILEPEVFLLFGLLTFLVAIDRPSRGAAALAGLAATLCLATRPTFLPAFLLTPLYFRWRGDRGRLWLQRSLALLVPVAAVLVLLAWRAQAVTGDPRTPLMNPGTVFFEGNNPLSLGTSAIYPPTVVGLVRHSGEIPDAAHEHYRTVARAEAGRELTITEVNAFWSAKAREFIRHEPGRFVDLLGDKLIRAFHLFSWHDVPTAWKLDMRLGLPTLPFAWLAALALVGTLLEARRLRQSLLYYALGASQLAVMLVFYVSARQRLVLLPALLYFAAVFVEYWRQNRRRARPWIVLVLLLALVLCWPDDAQFDERYRRRASLDTESRLEEVREMSRQQPLALHSDLAVAAVASAPWWLDWLRPAYFPQTEGTLEERVARRLQEHRLPGPAAEFDLGAIHLAAGHSADAKRVLEKLIALDITVYRGGRQPSEPRILLAQTMALSGDRERAIELLEEALDRTPGDPFALTELIALTDDPAYQEPLARYWSALDAQYLLGRALLRHGRPEDAVRALGFVARRLPEFRDAKVLLAAALGEAGHLEAGARQYLAASRIRLEPILASPKITDLFRRWNQEQGDGRPEVRLYAAQVFHQHGHFAEALEWLDALTPPAALAPAVEGEQQRIRAALGLHRPVESRSSQ
ncbi:MAG: hypothetical protein AAF657_23060 [Acidobacteriota bacterium]